MRFFFLVIILERERERKKKQGGGGGGYQNHWVPLWLDGRHEDGGPVRGTKKVFEELP